MSLRSSSLIRAGFVALALLAAGCTSFNDTDSPPTSGGAGLGGAGQAGQGGAAGGAGQAGAAGQGGASGAGQAGAGQGGAGQGGAGQGGAGQAGAGGAGQAGAGGAGQAGAGGAGQAGAGEAGKGGQAGASGQPQGCAEDFFDCNGDAADGCETNTKASAKNCGACGNSCSFVHASAFCNGGLCVQGACDEGYDTCDGKDGCEADIRNDPKHCGSCAIACKEGETCVDKLCVPSPCQPGEGDCDEDGVCETALLSDDKNCGYCGSECGFPNAVGACSQGACTLLSCAEFYGNCNGSEADGCEVDTRNNPGHCGGCGKACELPNAEATCVGGACKLAGCKAGFDDCDKNPDNGCETNLKNNKDHCGLCGNACPEAGGEPVCQQAQCGVSKCDPGKADCNGVEADGCEVDTSTDAGHCGDCGKACSIPNAEATCVGGACELAGCKAGFDDCDKNPDNGCETNLATSADHCGACGNACPSQNGSPTCSNGACQIACNSGYFDCNGSVADGCEVNLSKDPKNCGSCGKSCLNGGCNGICQAFTLSDTLPSPSGLSVATDHVLVSTETGKILRFNLDGTGSTVVDGSTPIADVSESSSGAHIVWLERGASSYTVKRISDGAAPVSTEARSGSPGRILAAGQRAYWAASDGLLMVTYASNKTSVISAESAPNDFNIVDGLVWTSPATGAVRKVPSGLSPVTTLASGQNNPWGIDGDVSAVYWVNTGDGTVNELSLSAASTPKVVSSGHSSPRHVVTDLNYVYFSTDDANAQGEVGQIRRYPRKGGAWVLIAGKQKNVVGLRRSDKMICWLRGGDPQASNGALVCRVR